MDHISVSRGERQTVNHRQEDSADKLHYERGESGSGLAVPHESGCVGAESAFRTS